MSTMRTTIRDRFGLAGGSARVDGTRHALLIRWLRRLACLGVFFAAGGAVLQALDHEWGKDAAGVGFTLIALAFVISTQADRTDRKSLPRD